jgi:large subunit ribosomal protein L3
MSNGFHARKVGMTQIYNTDGTVIPVSVKEVFPHKILSKTPMQDGTVQVLFAAEGLKKRKNKSDEGIRKQYNFSWENFNLGTYRLEKNNLDLLESYENIDDSVFDSLNLDVTGISKGKGTQGVMKRWGFKGQNASHGNSKAHRLAGGMGGCQDPGRVTKGKKQAGRMGAVQKTIKNIKVVQVDKERRLLFLQGSVVGNNNGIVKIKRSFRHGTLHSNYKHPKAEKICFERKA